MANYYYKSIVDGHHWKLLVMDCFGEGICQFNFPSFTTDKLTGTLLPDATLVDTGIMKNIHDTEGMQNYLRNNDWIHDDDVLLPWSEDRIEKPVIEYGERITRAKESDLVLLPENIEGTNCFNCRFINKSSALHGFCQNPKVAQIVTVRMCCCFWDAEGTKRIAYMLISGEDEFEKGGQPERDNDAYLSEKSKKYKLNENERALLKTYLNRGNPNGNIDRIIEVAELIAGHDKKETRRLEHVAEAMMYEEAETNKDPMFGRLYSGNFSGLLTYGTDDIAGLERIDSLGLMNAEGKKDIILYRKVSEQYKAFNFPDDAKMLLRAFYSRMLEGLPNGRIVAEQLLAIFAAIKIELTGNKKKIQKKDYLLAVATAIQAEMPEIEKLQPDEFSHGGIADQEFKLTDNKLPDDATWIRVNSHRARAKLERSGIKFRLYMSFTEGAFYAIKKTDMDEVLKIKGISKASTPKDILLNPL